MPLKNVPMLPHFLLMLLTGMRKSDALYLKWDDVDLDTGNIRYKTLKTQKICILPLIAENNRIVSPTMLKILKIWKGLGDKDSYVLPHPKSLQPVDIKLPLEKLRTEIKIPELKFQNLRKTFISYAVSYGIPPAIVAFWVGHSPAVAEKHYMKYAIGQLKGDNLEETMGISVAMKEILNGYVGKGKYKNLKLTKWTMAEEGE